MAERNQSPPQRTRIETAGWGVPIGVLGGLIGLGGGEFRIPILMRRFALAPRALIPVNASISLFTLAASLLFRGATLDWSALPEHVLDIGALAVGGVLSAVFSADLVKRLASKRLHQLIVLLLVALGVLLIAEGFLLGDPVGRVPSGFTMRASMGTGLGMLIGAVATLLGVAGGELLIPTLLFVYGLDIKAAGTASLIVSLCVVTTGLVRFRLIRLTPSREVILGVAAPMAAGSMLGAAVGAQLAAFADAATLKVALGGVLLLAAAASAQR